MLCSIHPPVLLDVPVSSEQPQSPAPALSLLAVLAFTMDLGRRKSCSEMALRALIPLPPVATRDVKVLQTPPERLPIRALSPWQRQVGWMMTAGLKFCYFWISDATIFSSYDQERPIKCISGQNLGFEVKLCSGFSPVSLVGAMAVAVWFGQNRFVFGG